METEKWCNKKKAIIESNTYNVGVLSFLQNRQSDKGVSSVHCDGQPSKNWEAFHSRGVVITAV